MVVELGLDLTYVLIARLERHVLGPATHRGQLDPLETGRRDAGQRFVQSIGVIAVGVSCQNIVHL